jgi:hypothetical protein
LSPPPAFAPDNPEAAGIGFDNAADGIGFDSARVVPGRRGLANLASRARGLGATFPLRSALGTGTLRFPPSLP